jgi:hypothetical protein
VPGLGHRAPVWVRPAQVSGGVNVGEKFGECFIARSSYPRRRFVGRHPTGGWYDPLRLISPRVLGTRSGQRSRTRSPTPGALHEGKVGAQIGSGNTTRYGHRCSLGPRQGPTRRGTGHYPARLLPRWSSQASQSGTTRAVSEMLPLLTRASPSEGASPHRSCVRAGNGRAVVSFTRARDTWRAARRNPGNAMSSRFTTSKAAAPLVTTLTR